MPDPLTPILFLRRAEALYPDRLAIVSGSTRLTHREFANHCDRTAAGLSRLGVAPGDRVAYLSFNNHHLVAGYFAPLLIRAVFMPLHARLAVPELIAQLRQAQPAILLFEPELAAIASQLRDACHRVVAINELPAGRI